MRRYLILIVLIITVLCSCVSPKVDDCPPLRISVEVQDKNFFNIKDAASLGLDDVKDENLPFREYISTIYYVVRDMSGTVVAEHKNYAVEGDDKSHIITLPSELPYGKYTVTVWGNMKSDKPLGDDSSTADLEAVDATFNDIYLGDVVVDYSYGNDTFPLPMKRTKGKLLILVEGIPENINFSKKTISNLYSVINSNFEYGEIKTIAFDTRWQERGRIITHTPVCPTAEAMQSEMNLTFADTDAMTGSNGLVTKDEADDGKRWYIPTEPVSIKVGRNELTVLRYHYDADTDKMDIYIMVNDRWEIVHSMVVD